MSQHVSECASDRRRATALTSGAAILLVVLGFAVGSCDTTAEVTFRTRSFSGLHSSGFIAPKGQCGSLGTGSSAQTVKLRFTMVDGNGRAIRPGQNLADGSVELTSGSISTGSTRVYEYPDLQCGGSSGVGSGDDRIVNYDGSCSLNGYSCGFPPDSDASEASLKRCQTGTSASVSSGSVNHISDTKSPQMMGVLMENTRSVRGFRPPPIVENAERYDFDGDGTAEESIQSQVPDLETDPRNNRITALKSLEDNWEEVRDAANNENRETQFGFWEIQGDTNPPSVVSRVLGEATSKNWTKKKDVAKDAVEDDDELRDVADKGPANPYEAMFQIIGGEYGRSKFDGYDKMLVVFVDGPPDRPISANSAFSVQDVIDRANRHNVRVFIVQLDNALAYREIYDDPNYWRAYGEDGNCSGNGDCKNFQTCREPRGYSINRPHSQLEWPQQRYSGKYCMPAYQVEEVQVPDGTGGMETRQIARVGPIGDYARIACETKGGYLYVKEPRTDLEPAMDWLPFALDGLWEANVTVGAFAATQQNFSGNQPIRMSSQVDVQAGGTTNTLNLSQISPTRDPTLVGSGDQRSVLFMGSKGNN